MIYLYYTGATASGAQQQEIQKSLGGYISGTIIPNARMNTLFRDITPKSKTYGYTETICIAVKNISSADLLNFKLYCELSSTTPDYTVEASVVVPSTDECGELNFETLNSADALPYYGTFNDIVGQANEINMGTFVKGTYLGIFLCKKFTGTGGQNNVPCNPIDFQSQTEADRTEQINFKFSWD